MLFKKRILCYVIIFDQFEIIKKSLDFLAQYADRLDLVIIENPSTHTPEIKKLVDGYGHQGLVKRYYLFDQNITGMAYDIVITKELPLISKSRYVMITDGDLTCDDQNWLDEEIAILAQHTDVFACGVSLDMSNLPLKNFPEAKSWIPPDAQEFDDYYEPVTGTGGHLLLMHGKGMAGFMRWKDENNVHFLDSNMHRYCREVLNKKWARTKRAQAYHLTWDLYQDKNHAYTKFKTSKSFDDMWRHKQATSFKLIEY